jgi:hypothetical protein
MFSSAGPDFVQHLLFLFEWTNRLDAGSQGAMGER